MRDLEEGERCMTYIKNHWKTLILHLLYIQMQPELKMKLFQMIKSLYEKSALCIWC